MLCTVGNDLFKMMSQLPRLHLNQILKYKFKKKLNFVEPKTLYANTMYHQINITETAITLRDAFLEQHLSTTAD